MCDTLFSIAQGWDTASDEERGQFREFIVGLVQYPCKIACKPNHGSVDIYVLSEKKQRVTDWLEMQPSGAIGVLFDEYEDPDSPKVMGLSDRCEDHNDKYSVSFASDSETESDGSE